MLILTLEELVSAIFVIWQMAITLSGKLAYCLRLGFERYLGAERQTSTENEEIFSAWHMSDLFGT